jgi:hypothetical protein
MSLFQSSVLCRYPTHLGWNAYLKAEKKNHTVSRYDNKVFIQETYMQREMDFD